ncbi:hypothetical protein CCAX7_66030 [Capsulimonas corticalis]|uniref:Uncharacterized protein n=1 Tax=Capsulimonas corticalis TaxID=2219043 RepID=A0A402CRA7_9BACT|nr:hypothetical protein [Capsulimonas corticalis]BDI34552.1 hypothetical protein CCAX7_66030 [Capsulimonas corticalis]
MQDRFPIRRLASTLALLAAGALVAPQAKAQTLRPIAPDTWTATDALGRSMPVGAGIPAPRKNRYVGIFYFLWHHGPGKNELYDNTKILADPAHPFGPKFAFHWWGEPAVGYFLSSDAWVHRKNLQMLGDAGVDVIFFDVTNAFTYPEIVKTVCDTAEQMRAEGTKTPQIAFIVHAAPGATTNRLYDTFYSKGLYKNLWFQWQGKPLILGNRQEKTPGDSPLSDAANQFFTWRESWAWDPGQDKWQWMDKYPQKPAWHADPQKPEQISVSIAGHPMDTLGRSYRSAETWGQGAEPTVDDRYRVSTSADGIQFAQQWKRALAVDPEFIFITGWNEWIAQRFLDGGPTLYAGRPRTPGTTFFVDAFNEEFSRDAMPMKGGYADNYYMQLAENIRKFKGAAPQPIAHGSKTISAPGAFAAWRDVQPRFLDAVGDTTHRDSDGWGAHHYTDTSGRNDITSAKVACDAKNIAFYVHTRAALTPYTGKNWMQLLIDADSNPKTGWNGYDFVVNSRVLSPGKTTLKRLSDSKTWTVPYRAAGNEMQVVIPRALLGLTNTRITSFDFHWVDNAPIGGEIADWWYVGDSAPDGRFNYHYRNRASSEAGE